VLVVARPDPELAALIAGHAPGLDWWGGGVSTVRACGHEYRSATPAGVLLATGWCSDGFLKSPGPLLCSFGGPIPVTFGSMVPENLRAIGQWHTSRPRPFYQ